MAAATLFNQFKQDIANKVHNLGADSLKILLTNTAPVVTNAVKADVTEISAGNGYSAGGNAVTITSSTQTSGTYKLIPTSDPVITATGSIGPFRYAVLYNDTPTSPAKPLIAFWDNGSGITLTTGQTFTLDLDQSGGLLTW